MKWITALVGLFLVAGAFLILRESADTAPEKAVSTAPRSALPDRAGNAPRPIESAPLAIPTPGATSLVGFVTDPDGRPVGGASIKAWPESSSGGQRSQSAAIERQKADARGIFILEIPAEEGYWLLASATGFAPAEPVLGRAGTEVRLRLAKPAALVGVVRDEISGAPLASVSLRIRPPAPYDPIDTLTDAEGHFALEDLVAKPCALEIEAPLHAGETLAIKDLAAGERRELKILLRPGKSLQGRVLSASNVPLSGAQVRFAGRPAETDHEGRFALSRLPPVRGTLTVRAEGYQSDTRELDFRGARVTKDLTIRLREGATIRGVVRTHLGAVVPSARIEGFLDPTGAGKEASRNGFSSGFPLDRKGLDEVRTDALGRFVLGDLPLMFPLPLVLQAQTPTGQIGTADSIPMPKAGESAEVAIVVGPGVDLIGEVLSTEGGPIFGARLRLLRYGFQATDPGTLSAESAVDGRFAFSGLSPGQFSLTAEADGYAISHRKVTLGGAAANPPLQITLQPGFALRGRVTASGGAPIADAWIQFLPGGGSFAAVKTDAAGLFEVILPKDRASLVVGADGYRTQEVPVDPTAGELIEISLSRIPSFRGQVVEKETGKAIESYDAWMIPSGNAAPQVRWVNPRAEGQNRFPEGEFEVQVPPGSYRLRIESEDHLPHLSDEFVVSREGSTDSLMRFELERALSLSLQVRGPNGEPLRLVQVYARRTDTGEECIAYGQSGLDDYFVVSPLAAGTYELLVDCSGYPIETLRGIRLPEAASEVITLTLKPQTTLKVITDPPIEWPKAVLKELDRVGFEQLIVQLEIESLEGQVLALTDLPRGHPSRLRQSRAVTHLQRKLSRHGTAELTNLPTGSYRITATLLNFPAIVQEVSLAHSEEKDLRLDYRSLAEQMLKAERAAGR